MAETRQLSESEYADAKLLMGPDGLVGKDGELVEFEARGAVSKLFSCRDDEVMLSGPAGTGKSRGILEYFHFLLSRFPGTRALIARKTLVSLTESGLVTYRDHVLHRLDGVFFYGGSKSEPARFVYPNGSSLIVGGLDVISKVLSTDYDIIYVQEANEVKESDWETLTTRLRHDVMPFQQIVGDVNPQEPWHWILRRHQNGGLTMLVSLHVDNPKLYDRQSQLTPQGEKYMRKLMSLTGVRRARLYEGRWVAAEGIVYEEFSADIHIIDSFKIPDGWRRVRSIDFGFVNPFTCQWWAFDNDGAMYLYREWYRTQMIVSDHARNIKRLSGKAYFEATVADHDSEDRATLQNEGIYTVKARKAIIPGIEAVQKRLRVDERTGKPRLFIMRDALVNKETALTDRGMPSCLAEEINVYAWPPEDKRRQGQSMKELPLDEHNHGCDAMRYAVMYAEKRFRLVAPGAVAGSGSKWVNRHSRTD